MAEERHTDVGLGGGFSPPTAYSPCLPLPHPPRCGRYPRTNARPRRYSRTSIPTARPRDAGHGARSCRIPDTGPGRPGRRADGEASGSGTGRPTRSAAGREHAACPADRRLLPRAYTARQRKPRPAAALPRWAPTHHNRMIVRGRPDTRRVTRGCGGYRVSCLASLVTTRSEESGRTRANPPATAQGGGRAGLHGVRRSSAAQSTVRVVGNPPSREKRRGARWRRPARA